jgi:hypothetical protein
MQNSTARQTIIARILKTKFNVFSPADTFHKRPILQTLLETSWTSFTENQLIDVLSCLTVDHDLNLVVLSIVLRMSPGEDFYAASNWDNLSNYAAELTCRRRTAEGMASERFLEGVLTSGKTLSYMAANLLLTINDNIR